MVNALFVWARLVIFRAWDELEAGKAEVSNANQSNAWRLNFIIMCLVRVVWVLWRSEIVWLMRMWKFSSDASSREKAGLMFCLQAEMSERELRSTKNVCLEQRLDILVENVARWEVWGTWVDDGTSKSNVKSTSNEESSRNEQLMNELWQPLPLYDNSKGFWINERQLIKTRFTKAEVRPKIRRWDGELWDQIVSLLYESQLPLQTKQNHPAVGHF